MVTPDWLPPCMQRKCVCMTCAKALPDQWQVAEIAFVPLQLSGDNKVLTLDDEGDCQQLIRALQVSLASLL